MEFCDEPSYHDYTPIQADNGNLIGILDNALDAPLLILQRKVRHGILLRQLESWKETEDHAYRDCSRNVPGA